MRRMAGSSACTRAACCGLQQKGLGDIRWCQKTSTSVFKFIYAFLPKRTTISIAISLVLAVLGLATSSTCPHAACCGQQLKAVRGIFIAEETRKNIQNLNQTQVRYFQKVIYRYGQAKVHVTRLDRSPKTSHPRWRLQRFGDK